MLEAVLRVRDHSSYARATADSDARIDLWCNDHCDLLHVVGPVETVADLAAAEVGVKERVQADDECLLITDECLRDHAETTIDAYLARHDCLLLPPIRYEDGEKVVRVLALDAERLTAFFRDLVADFNVTVESKREVASPARRSPSSGLDAVLPTLSERQREILLAAHEAGYYEIPRGTAMTDIAEVFDIDRRTAEEHLRIAERKLFDAVVPYL
ncbi:helix-turn-helix domain-containing protein [Haloarchaeobius sp. HME9146]|uniref:helix-turn-helix domain-containing protein n=1 Tax=Haloarchaeobius sp. HME9146 TaxID=2978732 RepID=UPI0021BFBEBD|nr:helix-turn-helix domain-containing protein [Haloarchaeobius sp. HME9146]MCT9098500.1 helix-turn-helix domain-containing protein [Haloarchaeobius sp. HME9146]